MSVPYQITLVAFTTTEAGREVFDIVETSYKNASVFARRWYRNTDVTAIQAYAKRGDWAVAPVRQIKREV